jgi:hypothetical protein
MLLLTWKIVIGAGDDGGGGGGSSGGHEDNHDEHHFNVMIVTAVLTEVRRGSLKAIKRPSAPSSNCMRLAMTVTLGSIIPVIATSEQQRCERQLGAVTHRDGVVCLGTAPSLSRKHSTISASPAEKTRTGMRRAASSCRTSQCVQRWIPKAQKNCDDLSGGA